MAEFILPGAEDRTVVIGPTGSGKTVFGAFLLSKQRFDKRPWVCLDFKREVLWDKVGTVAMRKLRVGEMPGKRGLYRMPVRPDEDDALEDWFWKIWRRGNVGIFVDEVSLVPQKKAFKAILRQGRSLRIPVISCTQRPVDCDREVFSEAQYRACFGLGDDRDYLVIKGLFGRTDIRADLDKLPRHWSLWWDDKQRQLMTLRPGPAPNTVAVDLRAVAPRSVFLGG